MVDVPVVPAAGFKVNVGDIDIDIIIRRNQAIEIACSNKVFRESNIFVTKAKHIIFYSFFILRHKNVLLNKSKFNFLVTLSL